MKGCYFVIGRLAIFWFSIFHCNCAPVDLAIGKDAQFVFSTSIVILQFCQSELIASLTNCIGSFDRSSLPCATVTPPHHRNLKVFTHRWSINHSTEISSNKLRNKTNNAEEVPIHVFWECMYYIVHCRQKCLLKMHDWSNATYAACERVSTFPDVIVCLALSLSPVSVTLLYFCFSSPFLWPPLKTIEPLSHRHPKITCYVM